MLDALLGPFLDPGSRTYWVGLLTALLVAATVAVAGGHASPRRLLRALSHRSTLLDVQLFVGRRLLGTLVSGLGAGVTFGLATHGVRTLDALVGRPDLHVPPALVVAGYSLALFLAWDLSRFLLHLAMHRVPALWAFHQVHHSAEVLTPLTFHRVHPVESALYQLRGVVVTSAVAAGTYWLFRESTSGWQLLGVHGIGLILNLATGNLRHSEVWLRFGPLERWLLSPAQHQIHHGLGTDDRNYGTWIATWDRLAGTLTLAGPSPVHQFGISADARNHGDDLWSAWFGPIRQVFRGSGTRVVAALGFLVTAGAHADEPPAPAPGDVEDTETTAAPRWSGEDLIVYAADGTPRVAGSAHEVDAETLERWEYDDIEKVMATVPGVTTRGEDGFGLRPNIGIRGVNSDRSAKVTLLEDGVPLVPAPYAAPAAYYFPMSTRLTGVEVFKGPAATTHGPQTVGGAINLRTRDVPSGADGALDLAVGLRSTAKTHGWAGVGGPRVGILGEVVHLRTGGFKELDGGGPTGFERTEGMLKAYLVPAPAHRLQLKLGLAGEDSHETYLGLTLSDFEANPYRRYAASQLGRMQWWRTQGELSWEANLGAVDLHAVAYHHWLDRSWTKFNRFASGVDTHALLQADPSAGSAASYLAILRGEADSLTPEQALQIGTNDRSYHSFGVQGRGRWEVHGQGWSSTLRFGLRAHGDRVERLHTEESYQMTGGMLAHAGGAKAVLLDARSSADALAAHVQEELALGPLTVLPGTRLELIQTAQDDTPRKPAQRAAFLPGLGVLVDLTPALDVFAGIHKGFSPVAPGQPLEVRPEVSWNSEAGLRVRQGSTHAELTGFVNDYLNITGQCTISGGCDGVLVDQQFNGGRALVTGLEAVVGQTWILPNGWELPMDGSYALTHGSFRTTFSSSFPQFGTVSAGDGLPYVPLHSGAARLGLDTPRARMGLGCTARSGMRDQAGSGPLDARDTPPLFLLDASGEVQVRKELALYATGTNLTSSKAWTSWRPFGARPTAPLQVMIGLKVAPATR